MAKKQTRRSISISRPAYERIKAYCELQGISMSQLVESRVADIAPGSADEPDESAGRAAPPVRPSLQTPVAAAKPAAPSRPAPAPSRPAPAPSRPAAPPVQATPRAEPPRAPAPMTSAAARIAVEPPPPVIKPRGEPANVKPPTARTADQIFTF